MHNYYEYLFPPLPDIGGSFYAGPPTLVNIGYVGASYDIFRGNPQATNGQLDPGFLSAQNIFQFNYKEEKTTTDGTYLIPDGTTVNSVESCSFTFSSSTTRSTQSYTDTLKVHVDANYKRFGASFSASSDYQEIHQTTSTGESVYVSSYAQCETYGASIDDAPLSASFVADVENLPTTNTDLSPYVDLIRNWGTHVASSIMMGGRYGLRSEFNTSSYNSLTSTKFNVKAAAGYSGMFSVSSSLTTDKEKQQANTYNANRKDVQMFQLGGKPPVDANGTAFEWAQTVKSSPMPLSYTLTQLHEYLTPYYFPADTHIEEKAVNLQLAMAEYCKQTVPHPDLCAEEYGPSTDTNKIRVSLRNAIVLSDTMLTFHQYSPNPNMRSFGAVKGPFEYDGTPNSPFVMADSRTLTSNLTVKPIGIVGVSSNNDTIRYKCPYGYSTVTDQTHEACNYNPPTIACVANECLTRCNKGNQCMARSPSSCYFIAGGNPELGNQQNQGFFRELTITDSTHIDDLFQCLTYKCLQVVT